ncbi:hypothetical protein F4778DRAFT_111939 [Xylariomycetidae sp. FL2044]|nr:hypothetical protein F4778DRAFT_111939 [Xylariomycetidae sp. FL2044]
MTSLESIFTELGISQYLDAFVDQGFDSWDTILDITESDLDALGVKLGHRRKLQRRIANYRGVAPEVSLVSPTHTSIEDARLDSNRSESARTENKDGPTVAKRKYRRHPKPDDNAPERPPSAYVLFSNKMREDLKGQNLTFTEIAKLVGENWQNLNRTEKEPFERQAHEAKEKYNRDLAEYKKTHEYRKYCGYLQDFRKRQASQSQDVSKRVKTETEGYRGSSSTSGSSLGFSTTTSGAGSGSESQPGSEPPSARQHRLEPSSSMPESMSGINGFHHPDETHSSRTSSVDDGNHTHSRRLSSPPPRDPSSYPQNRRVGWGDSQRLPGEGPNTGVPWLDPRGGSSLMVHSPENSLPSLTPSQSRGSISSACHSRRPLTSSKPPSLKTEESSAGSMSSAGSYNLPRTPSDASLPIHALLSNKPEPLPYTSTYLGTPGAQQPPPLVRPPQSGRTSDDQLVSDHYDNGLISGPAANSFRPSALQHEVGFNLPLEPQVLPVRKLDGASANGLDGISALLRARDIVDGRPRGY